MAHSEWENVLKWLVFEVLDQSRGVGPTSLQLPFKLVRKQWEAILIATFLRLGWVSESCPTERSVKNEINKAIFRLSLQQHTSFSLGDVVSIFGTLINVGRLSAEEIGPCPLTLLEKAQGDIVAQ